jgi:hypothetical protein
MATGVPANAAKKALAAAFKARDVRGTLNATKRFLLHEFYDHEDRVPTHHNLWVTSPLRTHPPS